MEIDCVELWQLDNGRCTHVDLQAGDDGSDFGHQQGWVQTWVRSAGIAHSRIRQSQFDPRDEGYDETYEMPAAKPAHSWTAVFLGSFSLVCTVLVVVCIVLVVLQCAALSSCDLWYEIQCAEASSGDVQHRNEGIHESLIQAQSLVLRQSQLDSERVLLKIKLVCHPRWLLDGMSLDDLIVAHGHPELRLASEGQAAVPYKAVVTVARESMHELGCILHTMIERRRADIGASLSDRERQPRFQCVFRYRWTFLHFGGALGCGQRRWRSCPARCRTREDLSLSFSR